MSFFKGWLMRLSGKKPAPISYVVGKMMQDFDVHFSDTANDFLAEKGVDTRGRFKILFLLHTMSWVVACQKIQPDALGDLRLLNRSFQDALADRYVEGFKGAAYEDLSPVKEALIAGIEMSNSSDESVASSLRLGNLISSVGGVDHDPFVATALRVMLTKLTVAHLELLNGLVKQGIVFV